MTVLIKPVHMALLDGRIVFVDDDDWGGFMVLVEQQRQRPQGHLIVHLIRRFRCEAGKFHLLVIAEGRTGGELVVTAKFLGDKLLQRLVGLLPGGIFYILEGEKNDRICSLVPTVGRSTEPDFLIFEINGGVLARFFEEGTEHVHVQGLAEAARAGKQRHLGPLIQKVLDQQGFVNIVIIAAGLPVIGHADGQGLA